MSSNRTVTCKIWAFGTMFAVFAACMPAVSAQADPNAGIEALVRQKFADAPEMIEVAKCESGFRQFAADGSVLRGGAGKGYIGIFQIGESLHAARAAGLGHDIMTIDGNIAYAKYLHAASGPNPWKECAPSSVMKTEAAADLVSDGLTANMRFGMRHAEVLKLQRLLNAAGFTVAASGGGSPGNETVYFGALTREAVRRFQCAKGIVCEGSEATTGYGRVGPLTRIALSAIAQ